MDEAVIAGRTPSKIAVKEGKSYLWCACGQSKKQPFCDGSHKGTSFSPVKFVAEKDKDVFLCMCKHSNKKPFCDGSHNKLDK
ncbi:MAG: CDGSH iron-sulfur domain-containing protein [Sneathiella sp.]|nr:CDGSH iron-sulfur domain-containing protein [Sneathiella sp.]